MTRLGPLQLMLANVKGEVAAGTREYRPAKEAFASLRKLTGQDFGEDIGKWSAWIEKNPHPVRPNSQDEKPNRFLLGGNTQA